RPFAVGDDGIGDARGHGVPAPHVFAMIHCEMPVTKPTTAATATMAQRTPLACISTACISSTLVARARARSRRPLLEHGDALVGGAAGAHGRLQMVETLLAIFSSERPPT